MILKYKTKYNKCAEQKIISVLQTFKWYWYRLTSSTKFHSLVVEFNSDFMTLTFSPVSWTNSFNAKKTLEIRLLDRSELFSRSRKSSSQLCTFLIWFFFLHSATTLDYTHRVWRKFFRASITFYWIWWFMGTNCFVGLDLVSS